MKYLLLLLGLPLLLWTSHLITLLPFPTLILNQKHVANNFLAFNLCVGVPVFYSNRNVTGQF